MRGSIQYDDMMHRTYFERTLIKEFIDERMENLAKSKNPYMVY